MPKVVAVKLVRSLQVLRQRQDTPPDNECGGPALQLLYAFEELYTHSEAHSTLGGVALKQLLPEEWAPIRFALWLSNASGDSIA